MFGTLNLSFGRIMFHNNQVSRDLQMKHIERLRLKAWFRSILKDGLIETEILGLLIFIQIKILEKGNVKNSLRRRTVERIVASIIACCL